MIKKSFLIVSMMCLILATGCSVKKLQTNTMFLTSPIIGTSEIAFSQLNISDIQQNMGDGIKANGVFKLTTNREGADFILESKIVKYAPAKVENQITIGITFTVTDTTKTKVKVETKTIEASGSTDSIIINKIMNELLSNY